MNERSCGVIPLRFIEGSWFVFLVKLHAGHWGFPKGHLYEGEGEKEGAERELFEETGLKVEKFLSVPPFKENYTFVKNSQIVEKEVLYFLALVEGDVELQAEEILEGRYVSFGEAKDLLTFSKTKSICQKVLDQLEEFT